MDRGGLYYPMSYLEDLVAPKDKENAWWALQQIVKLSKKPDDISGFVIGTSFAEALEIDTRNELQKLPSGAFIVIDEKIVGCLELPIPAAMWVAEVKASEFTPLPPSAA